jgi:large subunit ribosomal protein L21
MTTYAVIRDRGREFKVREGDVIEIDRVPQEQGATIEFDQVMLYSADDEVEVGQPLVAGAKVSAEVVGETRGDKQVVLRFRRRKDSRTRKGHRQKFTAVRITGISRS